MKLAEFAAWVLREGPFYGCDLDGGDVQQRALECGLIVETKYDPATHGRSEGSEYVEPGDPWFVFSPEMESALKTAERAE